MSIPRKRRRKGTGILGGLFGGKKNPYAKAAKKTRCPRKGRCKPVSRRLKGIDRIL